MTAWLLAAALLLPAPVMALNTPTPLSAQLAQMREQSRFVPGKALPRLQALASAAGTAPLPERLDYLSQLAMAHFHLGQRPQALTAAHELLAIGEQHQYVEAKAMGKLVLGQLAAVQNRVSQAHQLLLEAAELAATTTNIPLRVRTTLATADTFIKEGNLPAATERLQAAAALARRHGQLAPLVMATNALARLYARARQSDQGLKVLDEALQAAQRINSPGRLAMVKHTEYLLSIETGQIRRAQRALQDALALERAIGAESRVAFTLLNLADFHLRQKNYGEAAREASQALKLAEELDNQSLAATAHMNIGLAYLDSGRLADGKHHVNIGMAGYEQIGNKTEMRLALVEYGAALERAGDLRGALGAYHRERRLSDELFAARRQQAMLDLQEKYENDSKQRQIEQLHQENMMKSAELAHRRQQQLLWWLLAAFGLVSASVLGLMVRKLRRAQQRLRDINRELKQLSVRDPLTGLYNRRHFLDYMRASPAGAVQQAGSAPSGALFVLDVDHFKQINDSHGHGAGDAVLKGLADSLPAILRETDMIVRWGGEEFLAYLPQAPQQRLDDIAARILSEVSAQPIACGGKTLHVTVSIGYTPYPLTLGGELLGWERAIDLADSALYLAKSQGRDRAVGVASVANPDQCVADTLIKDLAQAAAGGEVTLAVTHNPSKQAAAA